MKGYKPEVTNPQHTKAEIFKGKVKNKITVNLCSEKFTRLQHCTVSVAVSHVWHKINLCLEFNEMTNQLFTILWVCHIWLVTLHIYLIMTHLLFTPIFM
jgi:hypothetical protein